MASLQAALGVVAGSGRLVLERVVVEGVVAHAPNFFSSRTATALGTNAETSPP